MSSGLSHEFTIYRAEMVWAGARGNPPGGLLLGYSSEPIRWVTPLALMRPFLFDNLLNHPSHMLLGFPMGP